MSAKEIAKFEHIMTLFGVGSAFQLLCSHNSIITHRKMKGKMKDMHNLEYLDPTSNTPKKLSEEELEEVKAFIPFMNAMQNETGPIKFCSIDITSTMRISCATWEVVWSRKSGQVMTWSLHICQETAMNAESATNNDLSKFMATWMLLMWVVLYVRSGGSTNGDGCPLA